MDELTQRLSDCLKAGLRPTVVHPNYIRAIYNLPAAYHQAGQPCAACDAEKRREVSTGVL